MLDAVVIDPAVRALRPDTAVLLIQADGLSGGPSDDSTAAALTEAVKHVERNPYAVAHVTAWHEAYTAFGAKPKRTRPSIDALLRRAATGLPAINALVDLYNAVSVRHALPIGGEDLAGYRGPARLVRAGGDEKFDTVAGGQHLVETPSPGEVIWRDDEGATCRRWNWRQCVRTRITEDTTSAVFVLERLAPYPLDALRAAGHDLLTRLKTRTPSAIITTRLIEPEDATG